MFDYVTSIDPALSTFGWKIIGLAHLAILVPLFAAFLPRDAATNWTWMIAMLVLVAAVGALNLWHFRGMIRSEGYHSPPPVILLGEAMITTVAVAGLGYALGGETGMFRPVIFVPVLLVAMIGNRWMIFVMWMVATVSVTAVAVASGTLQESVPIFVISYGSVWGVATIMVHLLAIASLRADLQVGGLAEVASIAARADDLSDGLHQVLPVIARWAEASWAAAYRVMAGDTEVPDVELLAQWPSIASIMEPTGAELEAAGKHRGVAFHQHRAVLMADGGAGEGLTNERVVIVVDGIAQPSYDQLMTQFNLERMVLQVDVLVNRSRYIAQLADLGRTDGLTGIPNRRALTTRMEHARADARRRGEPLAVVMMDLDSFKAFNDAFGHLAGDDLLRTYATELRNRLRTVDFVARYGGEEFCLVLADTDASGAEAVMFKLREAFRPLAAIHGVTFSAGIAEWDGCEHDDALIGRADRALYAAKASGRDCTVVDQPDL